MQRHHRPQHRQRRHRDREPPHRQQQRQQHAQHRTARRTPTRARSAPSRAAARPRRRPARSARAGRTPPRSATRPAPARRTTTTAATPRRPGPPATGCPGGPRRPARGAAPRARPSWRRCVTPRRAPPAAPTRRPPPRRSGPEHPARAPHPRRRARRAVRPRWPRRRPRARTAARPRPRGGPATPRPGSARSTRRRSAGCAPSGNSRAKPAKAKNSSPAAVSRPGAPADAGPTGTATCAAARHVDLPPARPGEPDQHRHEQHDADPADERPGTPHGPGHARDGEAGHHHDEPDGGEHRPVRQHVAAEHGGRRGRRPPHVPPGARGRPRGSGRAEAGRCRRPRTRSGCARATSEPAAATHSATAPGDDDRHRQPHPRRVRRRTPHPEHARAEHRGEPEDDRVRGPRTARDAGGHGVHPRTRTCRDQPHLGVISISMRFHCRGTRPAPLSTRPGAAQVKAEQQRGTELHLLTGAGTTAATATADAVVVGVLPARSDEDTERPRRGSPRARRRSTRPSTASWRRCSPWRARPAGRTRSSRSRPAGTITAPLVVAVGLGPAGDDGPSAEQLRRASGAAARALAGTDHAVTTLSWPPRMPGCRRPGRHRRGHACWGPTRSPTTRTATRPQAGAPGRPRD